MSARPSEPTGPLAGSVLERLSGELESLVARTAPSVVAVEVGRGQGSGVVLAGDGWVLTNRHVAAAGRRPKVVLAAGEQLGAELVGSDAPTDLAVLRVAGGDLPALPLAEAPLRVGQLVVAIGNPLRFERSVSLGIVSALERSLPSPGGGLLEGLVQTDAAINPGNSGGPLVDARGEVVGISTAIVPFAQGIGFAIPARTAAWVAAMLMQRGEIRRPWLGIAARAEELPRQVVDGAGQRRGVRVIEVVPDAPAERGGVRPGDILLAVDGCAVGSVDELQRCMVLGGAPEVALALWRGGARKETRVRPAEARPAGGRRAA